MVHSLPRYIEACGPRVNGKGPGSPTYFAGSKWRAARSSASKKGLSVIRNLVYPARQRGIMGTTAPRPTQRGGSDDRALTRGINSTANAHIIQPPLMGVSGN